MNSVVLQEQNFVFQATSPSSDWGPYLAKHRGERYATMDEPYEAVALGKCRAKDEANSGAANPAFEQQEAEKEQETSNL